MRYVSGGKSYCGPIFTAAQFVTLLENEEQFATWVICINAEDRKVVIYVDSHLTFKGKQERKHLQNILDNLKPPHLTVEVRKYPYYLWAKKLLFGLFGTKPKELQGFTWIKWGCNAGPDDSFTPYPDPYHFPHLNT